MRAKLQRLLRWALLPLWVPLFGLDLLLAVRLRLQYDPFSDRLMRWIKATERQDTMIHVHGTCRIRVAVKVRQRLSREEYRRLGGERSGKAHWWIRRLDLAGCPFLDWSNVFPPPRPTLWERLRRLLLGEAFDVAWHRKTGPPPATEPLDTVMRLEPGVYQIGTGERSARGAFVRARLKLDPDGKHNLRVTWPTNRGG